VGARIGGDRLAARSPGEIDRQRVGIDRRGPAASASLGRGGQPDLAHAADDAFIRAMHVSTVWTMLGLRWPLSSFGGVPLPISELRTSSDSDIPCFVQLPQAQADASGQNHGCPFSSPRLS
jgi:hypothetical protein